MFPLLSHQIFGSVHNVNSWDHHWIAFIHLWELYSAVFKVKPLTIILFRIVSWIRVFLYNNLLPFIKFWSCVAYPIYILCLEFNILLPLSNEACNHSDSLFLGHISCFLEIFLLTKYGFDDFLCFLLILKSLGLKLANARLISKRLVESNENIHLLFHHYFGISPFDMACIYEDWVFFASSKW